MNRRLALSAVVLLAQLAGAGCAPRRGPPLSADEMSRRIAERAAERALFRTLSATCDLSISGRRADGSSASLSCAGLVAAEAGRALRVRGEKVLGLTKIFDLVAAGDEVRFHAIHANKLYKGSIRKALARPDAPALPEEFAGMGLAALLFPVPLPDGQPVPEPVPGRREVELVSRRSDGRGELRTWLADDTAWPLRTEMYDAAGRRLAVVSYGAPREVAGLHPASSFCLRVDGKSRLRLEVKFSEMAINAGLNPAAFEMAPPQGVEVVDLDAPGARSKAEAGRK